MIKHGTPNLYMDQTDDWQFRIAEYENRRCSSGNRVLIVWVLRSKDPAVVFGKIHFASYPNIPSVGHANWYWFWNFPNFLSTSIF